MQQVRAWLNTHKRLLSASGTAILFALNVFGIVSDLFPWQFLALLALLALLSFGIFFVLVQREIAQLESRLTPKLDILWDTAGSFVHTYPCGRNGQEKCKTFRVLVRNLAEATTVHKVQVRLVSLNPPAEFVPIHLHLMNDNDPLKTSAPFITSFDLHAGDPKYVDVFYYTEEPPSQTIQIWCAARGIRNDIPKIRCSLTIQATGQDVPESMRSFVIDVNAEGLVSFYPATGQT